MSVNYGDTETVATISNGCLNRIFVIHRMDECQAVSSTGCSNITHPIDDSDYDNESLETEGYNNPAFD